MDVVSPDCGRNVIGCFASIINPAAISATINSTLTIVHTFWNTLPTRTLVMCASAVAQTTTSDNTMGEPNPTTPLKYFPNASAASATGAANPIVAETMPAMNPSAG